MARTSTRRLLLVAAVVTVVAAVAVVLTTARGGDEGSGIAGARGLAEEQARFESSSEAGETFALIASLLLDDARACVAERSATHPRCAALSEGVAYVQTVAVAALRCTGPGVFALRTRALEHLRAIERMDDTDDAPRPPIPDIPRCS